MARLRRTRAAIALLIAGGTLGTTPASAQSRPAAFAIAGRDLARPPLLDGVVAPGEWDGAATIGEFIQYVPRRGEPASLPTRVRIGYDSAAIYVAFEVTEEGAPTAQLTRRDAALFEDDAVGVLLDTHHDRQSAYYFIVNALGTQADGRIADDGRTVDGSWDAPWRAAARIHESGWTVEFAIPLAALSFRPGEAVTWGVNFARTRRRTLEQSFWAGPLDHQNRVSQAGVLGPLRLRPPPKRHQLIAYGLSRSTAGSRTAWDAGLDARYAITPRLALTATYDPDFATLEADRPQVNLTRFELSLPEKRPFFLEGSELFRQRIQTFYSRRVSDIRGGAKLFGRQGPWTLAGTFAEAEVTGAGDRVRYLVSRVQRSVGTRSNVAVMFADRALAGEHAGSVSTDASLFFTRTLSMTGQAIRSHGLFREGTDAWFLRPSYDSPTGHFHVRYTSLGERFADNANAIGFIRDDDRRELDSAIEKLFLPRDSGVERVQYTSNYNIYWSQAGPLRSWEVRQGLDVDLRNRFGLEFGHIEDLQRFEEDFRNGRSEVAVGYNTREFQSVRVGYEWGENFGSRLGLLRARARAKPTTALAVEYELERLTLDPDPELESTWIHVGRVSQFFTPDLFLTFFGQVATATDRTDLQAVFVYRYRPPFGTLQLAFQRGEAAFGTGTALRNTLFVKATTVF